jgi:hypothetical protein
MKTFDNSSYFEMESTFSKYRFTHSQIKTCLNIQVNRSAGEIGIRSLYNYVSAVHLW